MRPKPTGPMHSASSTSVSRKPPNAPHHALETSVRILIWHPQVAPVQTSALSKTPILRDVPQVKRKLTRRDRDSAGASGLNALGSSPLGSSSDSVGGAPSITGSPPGSGALLTGQTDYRSFAAIKSAAPSWLREKPSKTRLSASTPVVLPQTLPGAWRRGTMTCRESGALLLSGDDHALLHSIAATDLNASEIRVMDDSLFSRPNVLGIFARPSTFSAGRRSPSVNARTESALGAVGNATTAKDEPIFLCFSSARSLMRWRALLRTFAKPEIYGSPQSLRRGGTHRIYRQIDMTIMEAKVFAERSQQPSERGRRVSGIVSPPSNPTAEDDADVPTIMPSLSSPLSGGAASTAAAGTAVSHARRSWDAPAIRGLTSVDESGEYPNIPRYNGASDDSRSSSNGDAVSPFSGPIRVADTVPFIASTAALDLDQRGSGDANMQVQPASCFCQVWRAGEIVARTKVSSGTSSIAWFDKHSLQDLPQITSMHVEVLQALRNGKGFLTLGVVDVPVETMRRGEAIEGWFSIWTQPRPEDSTSRYNESAASYTREVVGELKMSLKVHEETVLAAKRYAEVEATLNGPYCVSLMHRLCKELEEDLVVSHLVDVFAVGGTIADRLADLTRAESSTFAGEPALLFRGNTLLSRALDKYQRRYCIDWLDSCIGATVRRICTERIHLDPGETAVHGTIVSQSASNVSFTSSSSGHSNNDSTAATLKRLCHELWMSIYANRHKCPPELRRALHVIRTTVNEHFDSSSGPGVQGVGAFVFLRLICPAITSPNLYGLMGTAPAPLCARTLMLVAKVFLALANKRPSFNRDKEPWLVKLNDFLERHGSAYDDFITTISTPLDHAARREPLGDEDDTAFQAAIQSRIERLPTLQRESIPPPGFMFDHSLSLASLVSYVVRGASIDDGESHEQQTSGSSASQEHSSASGSGQSRLGYAEDDARSQSSHEAVDELGDFVEMCCDIEDLVGYHIDRAGFKPVPIEVSLNPVGNGITKTTSVIAVHNSSLVLHATNSPSPGRDEGAAGSHYSGDASPASLRSRRATVSSGRAEHESGPRMSSISAYLMKGDVQTMPAHSQP